METILNLNCRGSLGAYFQSAKNNVHDMPTYLCTMHVLCLVSKSNNYFFNMHIYVAGCL